MNLMIQNQERLHENQEKSLLETRCSGALTRVYSAIVIEEDTTTSSGSEEQNP